MKKIVLSLALISILAWSCGNDGEGTKTQTQGKGDRYYGGVFRLNESEYIKTLFPPSIQDASSYRTSAQIYEGLYKFDQKTLDVIPGLADGNPTVSSDQKTYTVKIKQGVLFHDDGCFEGGKGRELKASDVKACFDMLCTASADNLNAPIFKSLFVGGEEFFDATANGRTPKGGVSGITVIDDYTIEFKLKKPSSVFKYTLARPAAFIYPKEMYEKYGKDVHTQHAVGTGPFKLKTVDEDIKIILVKNDNYYGKDEFENPLPFLDGLEISFIKEQNVVYRSFMQGELEMVYRLPTENIIEILETHKEEDKPGEIKSQRVNEMATFFLAFNMEDDVFSNTDLRKAFNYAVDKQLVVDFVLQGAAAAPGHNGITPPTFANYDISNIKGFPFNKDSAQFYLKKAGYPGGKGFPEVTLDYNPVGGVSDRVVQNVQKQIKENLGIDIKLNQLARAAHIENVRSGNSGFFRFGWLADYPNPESFVYFFNSPTAAQFTRFNNTAFDNLYESGVSAASEQESYEQFMKAENIAMSSSPIIPLWYEEQYRLLQPTVENFPNNPMQYRDFSDVYLIPKDELDKKVNGGETSAGEASAE